MQDTDADTRARRPVGTGKAIVRPRYTDKFRASCVVMAEAAGYPENEGALTLVARKNRIPLMTLSRWVRGVNNPPFNVDVIEQRATLTGLLDSIAHQYAEHALDGELIDSTSARDSAVVMGIAIDKLRILQELSGERMALVRGLFAACAAAGMDVDDTLTRMTARLNAMAEAAEQPGLALDE